MAKVFTVPEGLEVRIGNFGTATNTSAAIVPEAVAQELSFDDRLRILQAEVVIIPSSEGPSFPRADLARPDSKKRAPRAQEEK